MAKTNNGHVVTWDEVHRDTRQLVHEIMPKGPWLGIVALTRGGLVPAAILAREMDLRIIDTLCIASYIGTGQKEQNEINILKTPDIALETKGKGWLLIDDLVDTGLTAKAARQVLPEAYFTTVYAKPAGREYVDTFIREVSQDTWVYFPWDTAPVYSQPLAEIVRDD